MSVQLVDYFHYHTNETILTAQMLTVGSKGPVTVDRYVGVSQAHSCLIGRVRLHIVIMFLLLIIVQHTVFFTVVRWYTSPQQFLGQSAAVTCMHCRLILCCMLVR